ncbi:MAG: hypothetical protein KKE98_05600 [Nanoarchaeota archaeon]|nr:hypothetical protein [Nanoarchaeota archaeon]MBU1597892.1 hypothetical protein [Nanoarchaeota archaeon]MBU2442273.1 hypothetical protein [Nanoarchaeota archaeon]
MKINKNTVRYLLYSICMILIAPQVFAAGRSGINPLDRAIEMISGIFNIEVLQNNETVQIGFLKFMLFIVLFSVSFWALRKTKIFDDAQGKKTAGIVSFAFSMIGVFMMPYEWMLATGGLITVIMSSVIFLAFFGGIGYVAVFVLRSTGEDDKAGWVKNLFGLIILFILFFLVSEWSIFVKMPMVLFISQNWIKKFFKPKE